MNRAVRLCLFVVGVLVMMTTPALAQDEATALIDLTPSFGAGLIILGAGIGIGKIGASAVESMARQPETADAVRGGMLLAAALIEGATFLALIVCIIALFV